MAFLRVRETKSGKYHYQVEAFWDKKKQQPRKIEIYLGKENPKTGEVAPVRHLSLAASLEQVRDYGAIAVCRFLAERHGILPALREAFDEELAESVFLLAAFLVSEMMPLSYFEKWADGVKHEYTGKKSAWTSKGVSGILQELGTESGKRLDFLEQLVDLNRESFTTALIDITSISTYSKLDGWAAFGHNRDGESLAQVNVQLTVLEPCGLPVAMRMVEGSISDVSTLNNAILLLKSLGIEGIESFLDRGFFSKANLEELSRAGIKITIPVPANNLVYKKALKTYGKKLRCAKNTFSDGEDLVRHIAFDNDDLGRKYRFHLYLNEMRQADENNSLYSELEKAESYFKDEIPKTKREALACLRKMLPKTKMQFLKLIPAEDGSWQLERKAKALARQEKKSGHMLLLTDAQTKSGMELLEGYRSRDSIEKLIDNLKNGLELDRLRNHSYEASEGKLFVALVAMMLHSTLQKGLAPSGKELKRRLTPREVLLDLRRIKIIPLPDGAGMISEVSKRQRYALNLLGIPAEIFLSKKPSGKKKSI
jgi:transposase